MHGNGRQRSLPARFVALFPGSPRQYAGASHPTYNRRVTGNDVRAVKFRETLKGYDRDDVDDFLEEMAMAIDAGCFPWKVVQGVEFHQTWKGYHRGEVDQFLSGIRNSESVGGEGSADPTPGLTRSVDLLPLPPPPSRSFPGTGPRPVPSLF